MKKFPQGKLKILQNTSDRRRDKPKPNAYIQATPMVDTKKRRMTTTRAVQALHMVNEVAKFILVSK